MTNPAVEAYLAQLDRALAFDRRYARGVRHEVADHLYESIAHRSSSAHRLESETADLLRRFGEPSRIAAQFASVYVFRKLAALLVWLLGTMVLADLLGLFDDPFSWFGLAAASVSALFALPAILRARSSHAMHATTYRQLCTPMLASTLAVFLVGATLAASAAWAIAHCAAGSCKLFELALASLLLARLAVHRRQTSSMCALWRSVS